MFAICYKGLSMGNSFRTTADKIEIVYKIVSFKS